MPNMVEVFSGIRLVLTGILAQIPQDIPHQTEPVDFSSYGNLLFYIGVPLLMVILYILIRASRRKRDQP